MATLIQKSAHADSYDARIKFRYLQSFGDAPMEGDQFYRHETTEEQDVRASYMAGFGLWPEATGENAAVTFSEIYEGYQTICTPWEYKSGFEITRIAVADDITKGAIMGQKAVSAFASTARETLEYLKAKPFNTPTSTAGMSPWQSGGDGVALGSLLHPLPAGGVYANKPSTDVDISIAAIEAGKTSMRLTQNARGFIRSFTPRWLIVAPHDEWLAEKLIGSGTEKAPFTSDNTPNPVRQGLTIKVWNQLTGHNWFLQAAPAKNHGDIGHHLTWVSREEPQFDRDVEFTTGARRYKGVMRQGAYYDDWRGIYLSTGK